VNRESQRDHLAVHLVEARERLENQPEQREPRKTERQRTRPSPGTAGSGQRERYQHGQRQ
jgi:hypothetical protein